MRLYADNAIVISVSAVQVLRDDEIQSSSIIHCKKYRNIVDFDDGGHLSAFDGLLAPDCKHRPFYEELFTQKNPRTIPKNIRKSEQTQKIRKNPKKHKKSEKNPKNRKKNPKNPKFFFEDLNLQKSEKNNLKKIRKKSQDFFEDFGSAKIRKNPQNPKKSPKIQKFFWGLKSAKIQKIRKNPKNPKFFLKM